MRKYFYKLATNSISKIFKTPQYIILFLSDTCPNLCRHCWYNPNWKNKNLTSYNNLNQDKSSQNKIIKNSNLTFDELEKISKSISRIRFLSMTGGEAFLRDDLIEIIRVFTKNIKIDRLDIPTSGFDSEFISLKTDQILSKIQNPLRIDVSLDGLQDTHNYIRQNPNSFQNSIKTIKELSKLKNKYSNFDVSIITTVSEYNKNEIESLSNFIEEIFPTGEWMINIARSSEPNNQVSTEVYSAYKKANELVENRINRKSFSGDSGHTLGKFLTAKNSLRREIISEILENNRIGPGCSAGSLIGVIFNNGDVYPCETLSQSFGNIRDFDYNLQKIWNSKKAVEIRNKIQDTQCSCTHECFLSTSILLQPSCWFRLIKKL